MADLVWIPLYLDRLLGSPRWQAMKDFQRGWYMQLLLLCAQSSRPGYLPLDQRLWELAGAHRREVWEKHKSAVMACFKTRTFEAQEWIYNERLLHTIEHQHRKLSKSLELRNTVKNVSISSTSFTKPSLEEVKEYCIQRKNSVNADEWYSHYEANGWMVGRVSMKDWKAAVRTWEQRNYGTGRQTTQQPKREPTRQVERFQNNLSEIERAFGAAVGGDSHADGAGQAPRISARNGPLLEGKND